METTLSACLLLLLAIGAHSLDVNAEPDLKNVICPDAKSECPDGNTCCYSSQISQYKCCNLPYATCCNDGEHCCPQYFKCASNNLCEKLGVTQLALELFSRPGTASVTVKNVICPDAKSECPDGNTCCYNDQHKQYKCCDSPNADCCSDGEHCCPQGFKCTSNNQCERLGVTQLALELFSHPRTASVTINVCPNKETYCTDIQTCCKRSATEYGCCNIQYAKCCPDMQHCCPPDTVCNVDKKGCVKPDQLPQSALFSAATRDVGSGSVVCPDGKSTCEDGSTCCLMSYTYGCCPFMDAVCCEDKVHCCQSGFVCSNGECLHPVYPFLNILSAPTKNWERLSKDTL